MLTHLAQSHTQVEGRRTIRDHVAAAHVSKVEELAELQRLRLTLRLCAGHPYVHIAACSVYPMHADAAQAR